MSTNLAVRQDEAEKIERVLIGGDLGKLTPDDRISYYRMVCESVGLNPLTKPFEYITLNGKLTLYARKDCTDQLRNVHSVSVNIVGREYVEGCYVVTSRAKLPSGREDESIGAVPIENLKGEARANAMMKCETKSKRRVTLSICGLGILDEMEVESIPEHSKKEVQRITEDIPISAPINKDQGGKPVAEGKPVAANPPAGAEKIVVAEIVEEAKASLSPKQGTVPDGCIDVGQQSNFHRCFKDALRKDLRKLADSLAHDWLKSQDIVDSNGEGTARAILRESFYDVREAAERHAKSL